MSNGKDGPTPHVEVPDGTAAFQKFMDFTRKILAVPKHEVERKLAAEKASKPRRKSHG